MSDLCTLSLLQHLLKLLVVFVVWIGPRLPSRSGHEVGRQLSDGRACSLQAHQDPFFRLQHGQKKLHGL